MSGGVDSSAAALLLLRQGYKVFGMTMLHFDSVCNKGELAVTDARKVCKKLNIEHFVIEIKKEFSASVINDFISEYISGRTPNPCVRCNPRIKWGVLLQKGIELGADMFATGHYCSVDFNKENQRYCLIKSENQQKDQSYALWSLSQPQLAKTIFPLHNMVKPRVRELTAEAGLEVAGKNESQEICFIEDDDYNRFITEYLRQQGKDIPAGEIIDMSGKVIGQHRGYPFYTIGQRKGLGIALGRPVYVAEIDAENNRIRIGEKEDLLSSGLTAAEANWVSVALPPLGLPVTAHIRYNDPGYPAVIETADDHNFTILFAEPRHSVTPGQSAVLYDGNKLVGGGIIQNAIK